MNYQINDGDSIERLELISIRYMAWIGEALGHQTNYAGCEKTAISLFDCIEHAVQDALDSSPSSRAGFMMDNIARMRLILEKRSDSLAHTPSTLPTMADLQSLYEGCIRLGGQHQVMRAAFQR